VHLVDAQPLMWLADLAGGGKSCSAYGHGLKTGPGLLALNKIELLDSEALDEDLHGWQSAGKRGASRSSAVTRSGLTACWPPSGSSSGIADQVVVGRGTRGLPG